MKFKFDVNLNDNDYFEFNKFMAIKSTYGKKQLNSMRILFAVGMVILMLISLLGGGFTISSLVNIIPYAIIAIIVFFTLPFFYISTLKSQMKSLKKTGKMAFSPSSVIEFYDDLIIETTASSKTEVEFTTVERFSIVQDKYVYVHLNNITAYILPRKSFESQEQYNEFLEFIKTKSNNIDIYQNI